MGEWSRETDVFDWTSRLGSLYLHTAYFPFVLHSTGTEPGPGTLSRDRNGYGAGLVWSGAGGAVGTGAGLGGG